MAPALSLVLRDVEKRWPSAPEPLFAGLSFEVPAGEVVALVGPSGVGKSSLLRLLAGIDRSHGGTILVGGRPAAEAPPPGMVFQDARLLPWLTLEENLTALLPGLGHAAALAALASVGLAAEADTYPSRLSGGMQRRAALARALASNSGLLLLDEPFVSLDAALVEDMRGLLGRLVAQSGATTLLVTHSLADAAHLAHRVLLLEGRPARPVRDTILPGAPAARTASDIAAILASLAAPAD